MKSMNSTVSTKSLVDSIPIKEHICMTGFTILGGIFRTMVSTKYVWHITTAFETLSRTRLLQIGPKKCPMTRAELVPSTNVVLLTDICHTDCMSLYYVML